MGISRSTPVGTGGASSGGMFRGGADDSRRHLGEFLGDSRYEDGTPRRPGTLNVFYEDGKWKGCLNDRDQGLVAFLTGGSLGELLDDVERHLKEGGLDWRKAKKL